MSLWAGLAVLGFAMVFSVPRRTLPGIVLLSIAAHLLRSVFLEQGASLPAASLVAALFVGITAAIVAPRTGQAIPIYAFAPVIPLVPGVYMFDALTGLLDLTSTTGADAAAVVDVVFVDATIATLTIVALAVGAISPTLLLGRRIAQLVARQPAGMDG
jgi:uncharacterized membrane protein YjjB (DUF3815 family)